MDNFVAILIIVLMCLFVLSFLVVLAMNMYIKKYQTQTALKKLHQEEENEESIEDEDEEDTEESYDERS